VARGSDRAAAAIRDVVQRVVSQMILPDYGIVRQVNPLQVELGHVNDVIDSDELVVTQEVRRYDAQIGLKAGDALALIPMESDEYLAVGVVSNETDPVPTTTIPTDPSGGGYGAWSPGDLKPTASGTVPTGWLLCDGSTVSRTTYAALFAAIGTNYNTGGEAGTDFRLPNGVGRSLIGAGTGTAADATPHARGSYGGQETVTLALSQIPAHAHAGSSVASATTGITATNSTTPGVTGGPSVASTGAGTSHSHGFTPIAHAHAAINSLLYGTGTTMVAGRISGDNNAGGGVTTIASGTVTANASADGTVDAEAAHTHSMQSHTHTSAAHTHSITDSGHTHTLTIGSEGGGTAHTNLSPYFTGNWLIKT
jgi:microcystin-dependent protein